MQTVTRLSLAFAALGLLQASLFAQSGKPANPVRESPVTLADSSHSQEPASAGSISTGTLMPAVDTGLAPPSPGVCIAPCADAPPALEVPACPKDAVGLSIYGDFLYLKARGTDLIFAQPRDGSTNLSAPLGPQAILQPDYAGGFRVGADYALSPSSCVEASFTWWEVQTHAYLAAPTNPPGAIIQSNVTLPSIQNSAADSLATTGTMGMELRTGDVSFKHILCADPGHYTINWLAGAYLAYQREDMHTDFSILGATDVDTRMTMEGIGPRVGLDGELLCGWGIRLFGRTSANLLASHFGGSYNQFNVFAGNQGNIDYKSDRIVPVLDMEMGVGWVSPAGHVRVSAGYYIAAWFNTVTTPDMINAVQTNNFSTNPGNLSSDMTYDGLTFRVEFRF